MEYELHVYSRCLTHVRISSNSVDHNIMMILVSYCLLGYYRIIMGYYVMHNYKLHEYVLILKLMCAHITHWCLLHHHH